LVLVVLVVQLLYFQHRLDQLVLEHLAGLEVLYYLHRLGQMVLVVLVVLELPAVLVDQELCLLGLLVR